MPWGAPPPPPPRGPLSNWAQCCCCRTGMGARRPTHGLASRIERRSGDGRPRAERRAAPAAQGLPGGRCNTRLLCRQLRADHSRAGPAFRRHNNAHPSPVHRQRGAIGRRTALWTPVFTRVEHPPGLGVCRAPAQGRLGLQTVLRKVKSGAGAHGGPVRGEQPVVAMDLGDYMERTPQLLESA